MKLTCDLCGSALQVTLGGQSASCPSCGLTYSMERLKEMLNAQTSVTAESTEAESKKSDSSKQESNKSVTQEDIVYDVTEWEKPETEKEVIYEVTDWEIPETEKEIVYDVTDWEIPKTEKEDVNDVTVWEKADALVPVFDFKPKQFVMEIKGNGIGDLSGWVCQGAIGLGDSVYLDGDYAHPYTVYSINDDGNMICAKEGMPTELFIAISNRKLLKNVKTVTGNPDPVANVYNYPGTVREYFAHVFASTFSQYEIRADVPHSELKIPVNYMFFRDGKPVMVVFLIHSNNSMARYQVEKAARIFRQNGIGCTHFFENYRNDMPYVIQRIRGTMGK